MRSFETDEWSRYRDRLREKRQQFVDDLVSGGCDTLRYQNLCGRIAMIDEALELVREVRSGDDLRAPQTRAPLRAAEN